MYFGCICGTWFCLCPCPAFESEVAVLAIAAQEAITGQAPWHSGRIKPGKKCKGQQKSG